MRREDYVETVIYNGQMINVGIDDYGQCYYLEFVDKNTGKLTEVGCGTYNSDYMGEIEWLFGEGKK